MLDKMRQEPTHGVHVLHDPALNKGTAFTHEERERLGIVERIEVGADRPLRRAFLVAKQLQTGKNAEGRGRTWDARAAGQRKELDALFADPVVKHLLTCEPPTRQHAGDLEAARRYAARIALEALRLGYEDGFASGIQNDARLFGKVVASPSGQEWCRRFLAKDPQQSSFLTLLPPREESPS